MDASSSRGSSPLPPPTPPFRSRSLSHAHLAAVPAARPRLPRYKSAPQTDTSDGEGDDAGVYERTASADGELAALIGMIGRRGSWCESEDDDNESTGSLARRRPTKAQLSRAKKSWRELYAVSLLGQESSSHTSADLKRLLSQTLPNLFAGFPSASSARRPPPRRCVLGKAPPAVGLVGTPANELFEWVLHGELPPASSRRGSRQKSSARYVRQTSLEIHLQPPFSSSWFQQQQYPTGIRSAEHLLPPWEPLFSAASPVGSDRTIRPSRHQQEQAERQRQTSPARSTRSTASSRAQSFAPSSPLARWERQHRRTESTPLPASSLGGRSSLRDYDDGLSVSPTSSISSQTPRVARRLSRVGPGDQMLGSMTARFASPPPASTASRRLAYQSHHSKAPSLSNTISSTAASSLTSPSHTSSFRFSSSIRSRPAALLSLPQHAYEPIGPVTVKDYRFSRRSSTQSELHESEGLLPLPLDITNSSLADLVFASLRTTSAMDAPQKPTTGLPDQPGRSRHSFSTTSTTAGNDDVFCVPTLPTSLHRGDEHDGLRRSRTSAGTSRRSTLPTLVGSLR